ncbi:unnamed protein product [Rotaria sp. Silwood1]|nr:unnamed protein product [Rotaria sp. Silwood1]
MRDTPSTAHFHQFIFSNGFPLVHKCNLSRINISYPWTLSPSLRGICVGIVDDSRLFERLLASCPNLTRLDLKGFQRIRIPLLTFQHANLKRLHLTGSLPSEYKKELEEALDRERALEEAKAQLDIDWHVLYLFVLIDDSIVFLFDLFPLVAYGRK